jgi:hypothetical protein
MQKLQAREVAVQERSQEAAWPAGNQNSGLNRFKD